MKASTGLITTGSPLEILDRPDFDALQQPVKEEEFQWPPYRHSVQPLSNEKNFPLDAVCEVVRSRPSSDQQIQYRQRCQHDARDDGAENPRDVANHAEDELKDMPDEESDSASGLKENRDRRDRHDDGDGGDQEECDNRKSHDRLQPPVVPAVFMAQWKIIIRAEVGIRRQRLPHAAGRFRRAPRRTTCRRVRGPRWRLRFALLP